jgi:hypothetical protein
MEVNMNDNEIRIFIDSQNRNNLDMEKLKKLESEGKFLVSDYERLFPEITANIDRKMDIIFKQEN